MISSGEIPLIRDSFAAALLTASGRPEEATRRAVRRDWPRGLGFGLRKGHMGSASGFICRACGARFMAKGGGGFFFDLLHCDTCGSTRSVGHEELGDIHLRFVKGLPGPYAVSRMAMDRRIQREYPGEPLTRDEYHAAAEATVDACGCGGRFRYDAPARCPGCRSTSDQWERDPKAPHMFYD